MNVFLWNARARNGHVEATLNHHFPAQALYLYESYASTLDARRIFAYGYSNGGFLAQRVACDHADLFAGVWSQAGALVAGAGDYTDLADNAYCSPSSPIHVVNEHAVGDSAIPYCARHDEICS